MRAYAANQDFLLDFDLLDNVGDAFERGPLGLNSWLSFFLS